MGTDPQNHPPTPVPSNRPPGHVVGVDFECDPCFSNALGSVFGSVRSTVSPQGWTSTGGSTSLLPLILTAVHACTIPSNEPKLSEGLSSAGGPASCTQRRSHLFYQYQRMEGVLHLSSLVCLLIMCDHQLPKGANYQTTKNGPENCLCSCNLLGPLCVSLDIA